MNLSNFCNAVTNYSGCIVFLFNSQLNKVIENNALLVLTLMMVESKSKGIGLMAKVNINLRNNIK